MFAHAWILIRLDVVLCHFVLTMLTHATLNVIGSNNLVGSLPVDALQVLSTNLELLSVHDNALSGSISDDLISSLTLLRSLDVGNNDLTGTISASFGKLSQLSTLRFHRNNLEGSFPAEIGSIYHVLQEISGYENSLTGSFPWESFLVDSSEQNAIALSNVNIGSNYITGQIPSNMTGFSNMRSLVLSKNLLEGELPDLFFSPLRSLQNLDLSVNRFEDGASIPTTIGTLTMLRQLRLSWTQLVGSVPTELGLLGKLKLLDLNINQLEGTLPSELGNLHELTQLSIHSNRLTGTVPSEFSSMSSLRKFQNVDLGGDAVYSFWLEVATCADIFYYFV